MNERKESLSGVPQSVELSLGEDIQPTALINGEPVDNLLGLGIETVGDDVDYAIVTIKVRVRADKIHFAVEQIDKPSYFATSTKPTSSIEHAGTLHFDTKLEGVDEATEKVQRLKSLIQETQQLATEPGGAEINISLGDYHATNNYSLTE